MNSPRRVSFGTAKAIHPHAWLWEPLAEHPSFVLRPMFGAKAVYLTGRLVLCFVARAEPWRGVLVCTDRSHHASLIAAFRSLSPHPILPKWLYLPESAADFESAAQRLVQAVRSRDARIGVEGGKKRRNRSP